MALALLRLLSDNCLKQAQSNTIVPKQEERDRVGFEPHDLGNVSFLLSEGSYGRRT
jgi:hypothetical protein